MDQTSPRNDEAINSATRLSQLQPFDQNDKFSGLRGTSIADTQSHRPAERRERSDSFRQKNEEEIPGKVRQIELRALDLNLDG